MTEPQQQQSTAWYKDALGATEVWTPGGVVGLEVDGAPFFLHEVNPKNPSENSPDPLGITSTRIELFVDDPDRFIELGRVETLISTEADFYLGWE